MSPDEVFAAQMWPWPDPIVKRDAMGRILFVNAAFLRLYGGSIEDWRGNTITGWHAPQAPGTPYRFEIRVPSAETEMVYDWIEQSLADGSTLAVARDVTYLSAPKIVPTAPLPVEPIAAVAPVAEAFAEPAYEEPVFENAVTQEPVQPIEPVFEATSEPEYVPESTEPEALAPAPEPASAAPLETILDKDDSHFTSSEDAEAPALAAEEAQHNDARDEQRDFERRALPIENGDAVLGNNWRDAVIAKAVGAAAPAAAVAGIAAGTTQEADAAPEASSSGPLKILLAEDNAINALLTRTLLEADGCDVDTVEDGAKAVDAVKAQHYDLIFMDMRMPNMDGLEATRKIRALSNRSKSLPIIALTANAFDDDRNACFDSGMNDFMTKPVSAEELSEMVITWTKNREQRIAS